MTDEFKPTIFGNSVGRSSVNIMMVSISSFRFVHGVKRPIPRPIYYTVEKLTGSTILYRRTSRGTNEILILSFQRIKAPPRRSQQYRLYKRISQVFHFRLSTFVVSGVFDEV